MVFLYRSPTRRQANRSEFIPFSPRQIRETRTVSCLPLARYLTDLSKNYCSLCIHRPGSSCGSKGVRDSSRIPAFLFEEAVSSAEVSLDVDGQRASLLGPFNVNDPSSFAPSFPFHEFRILLRRIFVYFRSFFEVFFLFFSKEQTLAVDDCFREEKEEGGN